MNKHLAVQHEKFRFVVCHFLILVFFNKLGVLTSRGCVATCIRCGENYYMDYLANFMAYQQ